MGTWIALGALLVTVIGGLGALTYRNDRTWPQFRDKAYNGLAGLFGMAGFTSLGFLFARMFPERIKEMFAATAVVCGCAVCLLLLVWFADWNRQP